MSFVSAAYNTGDKYNRGFTKGSRTSDNLFILQGLVQRQLILGKPLYLCMVDFSKAFDLVNRNNIFFKLINAGVHGKVIDTLRNLYRKTYFRVKYHGLLSPPTLDTHGVNQGGNTSPPLFCQYLSDLDNYLHQNCGLCIADDIIVHLLWADDLVLVSDSDEGLQKQLNGLFTFCEKNLMIVNELKTKVITFGCKGDIRVLFNGQQIETTSQYKYLGNVISTTQTSRGDIFRENYDYLCSQARKAIFCLKHLLKPLGALPPRVLMHMYETLICPILVYGSDVWGSQSHGTSAVDKIISWYMRCILQVKLTTSNISIVGESGQIPPSVSCHIKNICYVHRLQNITTNNLVSDMYMELLKLHECGFNTWVSKALNLVQEYGININMGSTTCFNRYCKSHIYNHFKISWKDEKQNIDKKPILRNYKTFKSEFGMEPYLHLMSDFRYRNALTRLRTSSHTSDIERGRYTTPKTPVCDRRCRTCDVTEDEMHFLLNCVEYGNVRDEFYAKVENRCAGFSSLNDSQNYSFLMTNTDPYILVWLGQFIYQTKWNNPEVHWIGYSVPNCM